MEGPSAQPLPLVPSASAWPSVEVRLVSGKPRISMGHVIWAYDGHIKDWRREGMSVNAIRTLLKDEHHLSVGAEAIRAVLATYGL